MSDFSDWSDAHSSIFTITDLELRDGLTQLFRELCIHPFPGRLSTMSATMIRSDSLNEESIGANACLSRRAKLANDGAFDSFVYIGVVED
jgi:hypothetical protein